MREPMHVGILGAGYTGLSLAAELLNRGQVVTLVARRGDRLEATAAAMTPRPLVKAASTTEPAALKAALGGVDRLVHLAPPPPGESPLEDAARVNEALPRTCDRVVYGSTTGVFLVPDDRLEWVDEDWPAEPKTPRGKARLAYELGLQQTASAPVYIVRIAGIYGPGRTMADRLRSGEMVFWEGGRLTSRIHRDDLARLLAEMVTHSAPPPRIVACDEAPAETLAVARWTADVLGLPPPRVMPESEAVAQLSPMALEFRRGGKRCRSLHRAALMGALEYPTYKEGIRASLLKA